MKNTRTTPGPPAAAAHRAGRGWAYAGLIFGSGSSITANVGHAFLRPANTPAGWKVEPGAIAWGVAVAVALLISVEVLARVEWPTTLGWRLVRYAGGSTVALVAAGTSYRHLSDLLRVWHETTPVVYGGPAIVDGLMILCSFALMIPATAPAVGVTPAGMSAANREEPIERKPPMRPVAPVRLPNFADPLAAGHPGPDQGDPVQAGDSVERGDSGDAVDTDAGDSGGLDGRRSPRPRSSRRPAAGPSRSESTRPDSPVHARPEDLARVASAVAAGSLPPSPSAKAIRVHLGIGAAYARAARDALTATPGAEHLPFEDAGALHPTPEPNHETDQQQPIPEPTEQYSEQQFQQSIQEPEASQQRTSPGMPERKSKSDQTYATQLS